MRTLAIGFAGLCVALTATAAAETGPEVRARGEQLAKQGRYSEAIDAFKAAEKLEPRALHSCLIGLAYLRRELWPQAEIFLAQCEARATAADPVPSWMAVAKQQLAERLSVVPAAPVTIRVEPDDAGALISVSSFAPDERFTPRTIHLPPGRHVIVARAPGFPDAEQTVEIVDRTPHEVTLTLARPITATPPAPLAPAVVAPSRSKVPLAVIVAGLGVGALGAGVHVFAARPARQDLLDAMTEERYREREDDFDRWRALTIGCYAVGAAAVITGVVLRYTVFEEAEHAPAIAVEPRDGGGVLSIGWTR